MPVASLSAAPPLALASWFASPEPAAALSEASPPVRCSARPRSKVVLACAPETVALFSPSGAQPPSVSSSSVKRSDWPSRLTVSADSSSPVPAHFHEAAAMAGGPRGSCTLALALVPSKSAW